MLPPATSPPGRTLARKRRAEQALEHLRLKKLREEVALILDHPTLTAKQSALEWYFTNNHFLLGSC